MSILSSLVKLSEKIILVHFYPKTHHIGTLY